jgi:hypothetical protein
MPDRRAAALLLSRSPDLPFRGHDEGTLRRLGRGAYVLEGEWRTLFVEARLRTRVVAVDRRLLGDGSAFGRAAALALHGLPVLGLDDHVDLVVGVDCTRHNASDVRRHHEPLPPNDVVLIDGLRVTTLDRTIYDVIRLGSLEGAVIAFDAALRKVAWDAGTNTYDKSAAEAFRALVRRRVRAHTGARGIRQARFVVEFADGRAQLPGESLLRLRMWQAGLPVPILQYRVELGGQRYALLDCALPARGRWLEFDGEIKYTDAAMMVGGSLEATLAAQAERQAAVESATGWRCDRPRWRHVRTIDAFTRYQHDIELFP